MEIAVNLNVLKNLIENNEMVLIYFSGNSCSVCTAIKPKIENVLKQYSKIKTIEVKTENSLDVAANYNIFTIPAVILFIDGKEIFRDARFISIDNLRSKLSRYYELYFI